MMFQIKHLDLPACNHGEGLIWVEESKKLVWVDVFEKPEVRIFNFELNQYKSIPVTGPITSVVPHLGGGFVASMNGGFYLCIKTYRYSFSDLYYIFDILSVYRRSGFLSIFFITALHLIFSLKLYFR